MAKKKEMNRTSGTAKRKAPNTMSASERIGRQRQAEAANPGPRDKFNPAAAQGVVDTFGVGVNASGKFEFNPITTLGMALPVGKLVTAAKALRGAGKVAQAVGLEARVLAKQAGRELGPQAVKNLGPKTLPPVGPTFRKTSESVFPRLPSAANLPPGSARTFDTYADPLLEGAGRFARGTKRGNKLVKAIEKNEVQSGMYIGSKEAIKRAAFNSTRPAAKLPKGGRTLQLPDNATERFAAIDRTFSNLGAVRPAVPGAKKVATFPKRVVEKLPEPGSVEMVKKTAKQFGQKVSGKGAKNISRLLKGRGK